MREYVWIPENRIRAVGVAIFFVVMALTSSSDVHGDSLGAVVDTWGCYQDGEVRPFAPGEVEGNLLLQQVQLEDNWFYFRLIPAIRPSGSSTWYRAVLDGNRYRALCDRSEYEKWLRSRAGRSFEFQHLEIRTNFGDRYQILQDYLEQAALEQVPFLEEGLPIGHGSTFLDLARSILGEYSNPDSFSACLSSRLELPFQLDVRQLDVRRGKLLEGPRESFLEGAGSRFLSVRPCSRRDIPPQGMMAGSEVSSVPQESSELSAAESWDTPDPPEPGRQWTVLVPSDWPANSSPSLSYELFPPPQTRRGFCPASGRAEQHFPRTYRVALPEGCRPQKGWILELLFEGFEPFRRQISQDRGDVSSIRIPQLFFSTPYRDQDFDVVLSGSRSKASQDAVARFLQFSTRTVGSEIQLIPENQPDCWETLDITWDRILTRDWPILPAPACKAHTVRWPSPWGSPRNRRELAAACHPRTPGQLQPLVCWLHEERGGVVTLEFEDRVFEVVAGDPTEIDLETFSTEGAEDSWEGEARGRVTEARAEVQEPVSGEATRALPVAISDRRLYRESLYIQHFTDLESCGSAPDAFDVGSPRYLEAEETPRGGAGEFIEGLRLAPGAAARLFSGDRVRSRCAVARLRDAADSVLLEFGLRMEGEDLPIETVRASPPEEVEPPLAEPDVEVAQPRAEAPPGRVELRLPRRLTQAVLAGQAKVTVGNGTGRFEIEEGALWLVLERDSLGKSGQLTLEVQGFDAIVIPSERLRDPVVELEPRHFRLPVVLGDRLSFELTTYPNPSVRKRSIDGTPRLLSYRWLSEEVEINLIEAAEDDSEFDSQSTAYEVPDDCFERQISLAQILDRGREPLRLPFHCARHEARWPASWGDPKETRCGRFERVGDRRRAICWPRTSEPRVAAQLDFGGIWESIELSGAGPEPDLLDSCKTGACVRPKWPLASDDPSLESVYRRGTLLVVSEEGEAILVALDTPIGAEDWEVRSPFEDPKFSGRALPSRMVIQLTAVEPDGCGDRRIVWDSESVEDWPRDLADHLQSASPGVRLLASEPFPFDPGLVVQGFETLEACEATPWGHDVVLGSPFVEAGVVSLGLDPDNAARLYDPRLGHAVSRCAQPTRSRECDGFDLRFEPEPCLEPLALVVVSLDRGLGEEARWGLQETLVDFFESMGSLDRKAFEIWTLGLGGQPNRIYDCHRLLGTPAQLQPQIPIRFGQARFDAVAGLNELAASFYGDATKQPVRQVLYIAHEANPIHPKSTGMLRHWDDHQIELTVLTTGDCQDWLEIAKATRCERLGGRQDQESIRRALVAIFAEEP